METVIVPLVKNKTGDITDVNNYRPIALVTVASKIFEIVLLDLLEPFLSTCDNQFGFKKGHSTDHCIFVLKNAIDYYRSYNSPVYTCFLDASKCFDKINHWTLFKKMIARGIPLLFVRILVYWYRNQTFCIKWGSVSSRFFTVSNGVRQCGILSPYLFTLYVNDLSLILNA
jgi:retron-type reverse transcriptase